MQTSTSEALRGPRQWLTAFPWMNGSSARWTLSAILSTADDVRARANADGARDVVMTYMEDASNVEAMESARCANLLCQREGNDERND